MSVRLAVNQSAEEWARVFLWETPTAQLVDRQSAGTELDDKAWLYLDEEVARAIYEALADHFGHTINDVRTLRRDYLDERARVDKFIDATISKRR